MGIGNFHQVRTASGSDLLNVNKVQPNRCRESVLTYFSSPKI